MHLADEVTHVVPRGLVGLDHDIETRIDRYKVVVGDDHRDLNEFVDLKIEPGHFAIDPDQTVIRRSHAPILPTAPDRDSAPSSWGGGRNRNRWREMVRDGRRCYSAHPSVAPATRYLEWVDDRSDTPSREWRLQLDR